MAAVNTQYLQQIINQLLAATDGALKMDVESSDSVSHYVVALLGLGAALIPEIGLPAFALCNLLGTIFFPPTNTIERIWDTLRERVEELVDQKIEEYHLRILRSEIEGFQQNMEAYSRYFQAWRTAVTAREKTAAADTIRSMHVGFLAIMRNSIPKFQVDAYAVAALPFFSRAATIHLTLLADGIKHGKDWGLADRNVQDLRDEFKSRTSTSRASGLGDHTSRGDISFPGSLLEETISRGAELGIPTEVLDTWKNAHAALSNPRKDSESEYGHLDYPAYAKQICALGRGKVKIERGSNYQGFLEAQNHRACSDYDTAMVLHVLNFAEIWPFMTGDAWTATAARNVDREIFYGPFQRWSGNAPWTLSSPPPVTDRRDNITSIIVRNWDDIDGVQIKRGSQWDEFQGNPSGGQESTLDLDPDDYISAVGVGAGFKFGQIQFQLKDGGWYAYGRGRHAGGEFFNVFAPGYELSSIIITGWSGDTPTGCEGVILGFRPLITDPSRN